MSNPHASPDRPSGSPSPNLKVLLIPFAICAVLGVAIVAGLRPEQKQVPPLPELSRTNLVRIGDLWCQIGHTNPFTGILLEFYTNGVMQSRSVVSNGLLNGLSEGWYTNGQIQIREGYITNYSNGPRAKWYPDGHKLSEATIVGGEMQGVFRRWYDNGQLAEEIPMHNGKIEGVGKSYYESGRPKSEITMHDGQIVQAKNWPDGNQPGTGP